MLKVVVTGPESSGKTTLVEALSKVLGIPHVQEMARPFLEERNGSYSEPDLLSIARLQVLEEARVARVTKEILLCDTDLVTIQIWAQQKYGRVSPELDRLQEEGSPDLYLLCSPDIPWEPDPLRENPNDREWLFEIYKKALVTSHVHILVGDREARSKEALVLINSLLQQKNA